MTELILNNDIHDYQQTPRPLMTPTSEHDPEIDTV